MPESQRSRKQHQKATDIEKHRYVSPHVQTIQFLWQWKQQPHPLQTTCPRKSETFSWRTESLSNLWPPEQKEKKEKQNKTPRQVGSVHALLPAEAGPVVLITESGGPHRCPSNTADRCLQDPGFPHQLFFFFRFPREYLGWKAFYPWPPLRCPLSNGCLVSLQKFWSQCLGGLSTKWGPGTQSISCKNLAH